MGDYADAFIENKLWLFCKDNPLKFYDTFLDEDAVNDLMLDIETDYVMPGDCHSDPEFFLFYGEHMGDIRISFKYDFKKKVRATFLCFDAYNGQTNYNCICVLYNGRTTPRIFANVHYENGGYCWIEVDSNMKLGTCLSAEADFDVDASFEFLLKDYPDADPDVVTTLVYDNINKTRILTEFNFKTDSHRFKELIGTDTPELRVEDIDDQGVFNFYFNPENAKSVISRADGDAKDSDVEFDDYEFFC